MARGPRRAGARRLRVEPRAAGPCRDGVQPAPRRRRCRASLAPAARGSRGGPRRSPARRGRSRPSDRRRDPGPRSPGRSSCRHAAAGLDDTCARRGLRASVSPPTRPGSTRSTASRSATAAASRTGASSSSSSAPWSTRRRSSSLSVRMRPWASACRLRSSCGRTRRRSTASTRRPARRGLPRRLLRPTDDPQPAARLRERGRPRPAPRVRADEDDRETDFLPTVEVPAGRRRLLPRPALLPEAMTSPSEAGAPGGRGVHGRRSPRTATTGLGADAGLASALRAYQSFGYAPGPVLALLVLVVAVGGDRPARSSGLRVPVFLRRRRRRARGRQRRGFDVLLALPAPLLFLFPPAAALGGYGALEASKCEGRGAAADRGVERCATGPRPGRLCYYRRRRRDRRFSLVSSGSVRRLRFPCVS